MKTRTTIPLWVLIFLLAMPGASRAGVSVTSGLTYEKTVMAGESYQGVIHLKNNGPSPQEVKLYQTDYLFFCDGTNRYGDPGKITRSNAGWITFRPQRLTIAAHATAQVNYRVQAPDDASLAGTYWSMLMVEGISSSSPEATGPRQDNVTLGLSQVIRYGLQIVTQIGDSGTRLLKFLDTRVLKTGHTRILQVDMQNTGQRWLKALLWTELYDEQGRTAGRFEGGRLRLYPGTSVRFRVDLSKVPEGIYKALVVADCGGDTLFGATYTFQLGGRRAGPVPASPQKGGEVEKPPAKKTNH